VFGLKENELQILKETLKKYNIKAKIFGSRAKGNYSKGSDIDIVVYNGDKDSLFYLFDELDEKLPYFIDIIEYSKINNEKLKKHIDLFAKSL